MVEKLKPGILAGWRYGSAFFNAPAPARLGWTRNQPMKKACKNNP